ncbi:MULTISPECIES: SDR family NAD(P)-dependent oxidoreductase [Prochlorococcus]|uniref:Light-dependent protochlorophyllide reductase n=1 Tax=Prochlorococcus marinus str. MIT 9116 TaxID=167544 RepID=A0A0A1ZR07_PROMR|nr:SDR family NAD(P)-dependent oxidoreductase [Prochlorococcus marinus]KGF90895.1 Light-dependent protochlorophyllide reductase [Prochlorococcus marinus str. MIT 9107]KGF92027.1 Light-dependent protochlorophyllide reductase [Prochlorococcus marinus str. MIT 9116]KGF93407.1 Light-dependent protochlorophyllide reductase [Prochlorococcus marinus str. MIT 9123]
MVKNKNILITGGNSGIGFFAMINLLKTKNNIYLVIKSELRKNEFLRRIEKHFDKNYLSKYLNIIENCDLSDLENIKKIKDYIFTKKIFLDVIILNAGLQYTGSFYPKVSKQGIELTFAVNHLAHFYIVNLLKDFINNKEESRIIITSSDVHDPKSSGGNIGKKAGLNNLVDFREKVTGRFLNFNADESYKNSKLCNILFAKELSKKLKKSCSKISVITWAPGLVIPDDDSGFFRYSKKFNLFGYMIFSKVANNILGISENVENAGEIVSKIVFDPKFNNIDYVHLSNKLISFKKHKLVESQVSNEANSSELASKLWILSEEICGSFGFVTFNI